jgi:large exoprotein involved in heme utilization and adhesion
VVEEGSKVLAENAGEDPAGAITVVGSESVLVDSSLLSVSTESAGAAGTIDLRGGAIVLQHGGPGLVSLQNGLPSDPGPHTTEVGLRAETTGSGDAGVIEIDAKSVEVTDGAGISAQTVGANGIQSSGNGGLVRIVAADSVLVKARGFVTVESWGSSGNAGAIEIEAGGTLTVDGDWLTTITAGNLAEASRLAPFEPSRVQAPGNAGTIAITASAVNLSNGGMIQSNCVDCVGGAGQIHIAAGDLSAVGLGTLSTSNPRIRFQIGSAITANTFGGEGDAGSVVIDLTGDLKVLDGANISANNNDGASGDGGLVSVRADDVIIMRGQAARGGGITAISSGFLGSPSTGAAGAVTIEASSLVLGSSGGPCCAFISAETDGSGAGGDVTLEVGSLAISGVGRMSSESSGVGGGEGDAGTIEIDADSVVITDGGLITSQTTGEGDAGGVTIDADSIVVSDQGLIRADTAGAGAAGTISVDARTLLIERRGIITAGTSGSGQAGTIDVTASESIRLDGAGDPLVSLLFVTRRLQFGLHPLITGIFSTAGGSGGAGSIQLNAPEITLTDGALVATSTIGGGDAGEVFLSGGRIAIRDGAFVDSSSIPDYDTGEPGGSAGNVTLVAKESIEILGRRRAVRPWGGPEVDEWSRVDSATLGSGAAGTVTLVAPRILVDGGAVATTALPNQDLRVCNEIT